MKDNNGAIVIDQIIHDNENNATIPFDSVSWGYDSWQDSHRNQEKQTIKFQVII